MQWPKKGIGKEKGFKRHEKGQDCTHKHEANIQVVDLSIPSFQHEFKCNENKRKILTNERLKMFSYDISLMIPFSKELGLIALSARSSIGS